MSKSSFAFALILATVPAIAQQGLPPGLVPPVPDEAKNPAPGEPKDPLPAPAAARPAVVSQAPNPDEQMIAKGKYWEWANEDGNGIAMMYHDLTGKKVLVSSQAQQAEIQMFMPGPLTRGQMALILRSKLLMEGFSLEEAGPNLMKLVLAAGAAASTKTESQTVIGSMDELVPGSDEYVTYVMPMQFLKPEEAARLFQQVVGQFGPAGSVAPSPNASAVIISANTPLLRRLDELRKRIDVPSAKVAQTFVSVEYADVEELATQLNEIFNEQTQQGSSARVQRTANTPPIPGLIANNQGGGGGAGEETPINIIADLRTNRIFLMGRPVDIAFVESLILDFDAPSTDRNFLQRKLRYLRVGEFMPIAQDAIEGTMGGSSTGGGGSSSSSSSSRSTNRNTSNANNNRNQNTSNSNSNQSGNSNSSGSRSGVSGQEGETAPESVVIGKTLLVADNISNSIVVKGPPHHVEIIEKLIDQLDVPSQSVAITAVFGRYDIGDNRNFGVDLAFLSQGSNGDSSAGQNRTGSPSIIDLDTITDINGLLDQSTSNGGLSLYGNIGGEFAAFVNALESSSYFSSISRPTIYTTNNKVARISSGERIAVPVSSFTGVGSSGSSTNIEYRDIVLELEVLPLVNSEDEVTLDISLLRDAVGGERTFDFGTVPDILTEEINTIVTVPNRSTIVLGGLITENTTENKSGIPILSDIPGLGRLFSRSEEAVERDELVILIHPTIINNRDQLEEYQRESDSQTTVGPQARNSVTSSLLPDRGEVIPRGAKGSPLAPSPNQHSGLAPEVKKNRKKNPMRNGKSW